MKNDVTVPVLAVSIACLLAYEVLRDGSRNTPHRTEQHDVSPRSENAYQTGGWVIPLYLSAEMRTSIEVTGPKEFHLIIEESDPDIPGDGLDYESAEEFSVSYEILAIGPSLGPFSWTLHGVDSSGLHVYEVFTVEPVNGGYSFHRPSTLLGSSAASLSLHGSSIYSPPTLRAPRPPADRLEIYRGPSFGTGLHMANDPLRRFTYVVSSGSKKLWKLPWAEGVPVSEYPLGGNQTLLAGVEVMRVYDHSTEGHKIKMWHKDSAGIPTGFLFISDYERDGFLDGSEFVSSETYTANGYPDLWASDYVSYLSWLRPF